MTYRFNLQSQVYIGIFFMFKILQCRVGKCLDLYFWLVINILKKTKRIQIMNSLCFFSDVDIFLHINVQLFHAPMEFYVKMLKTILY